MLLIIGLAGCGSAKPLTRAQLVRRTDAICAQVQSRVKSLSPAKTAQEYAHLARKLAGFEQQELESMRKLNAPAALASDWKQIIEGVEEIAETIGTLSTDLQLKQQRHAAQALNHVGQIQRRVAVIVKRDGFKSCQELA